MHVFNTDFKQLRIAIVGCGTTGPATAIYLSRQGHEVSIFERAPKCEAVGAGFMLQPSGMAVLRELGVLNDVAKFGARVDGLHIVNRRSGKPLLDLRYELVREGTFALGLHRSVLVSVLLAELEKHEVPVHWGAEIENIDPEQGWLRTQDGDQHSGFDLIILADGAASQARAQVGLNERVSQYPWGAIWWMHPDENAEFATNELYQVVDGTRYLTGFLPTGRAWADSVDAPPHVSLFWSVPINREKWLATPIEEWKAEVLRQSPRAETLLAPIEAHEQLAFAAYHDVRIKQWHRAKVVLLGDVAHAMSPQLGQGVNLGLLDARFLSQCVRENACDLATALRRYSEGRRSSLRYYQFATRWLTPIFQSSHDWVVPARDFAFPIANRVPLIKKEMVSTMMGIKSGFVRKDWSLLEE
ncbi:MAG: NAD(P)/FAD-dependent oxidoreductase [Verrucomicrobiota bacterium]